LVCNSGLRGRAGQARRLFSVRGPCEARVVAVAQVGVGDAVEVEPLSLTPYREPGRSQ
jgi:hypothetical protein